MQSHDGEEEIEREKEDSLIASAAIWARKERAKQGKKKKSWLRYKKGKKSGQLRYGTYPAKWVKTEGNIVEYSTTH